MSVSTISLGLGLGGGKSATSSGRAAGDKFLNQYSVDFDGTDDYAALSSNITLSGSKSITFWAYIDTFSGGQKGFAGRNAYHYTILFNHHTSLLVRFGATPVAYTVSSISTGAWNHWAFTGDGTDFKLYKNGSLEDSGTDYGDVIITMIGAVASGTAHFSGKLDEIGLFASTLSASDVSSIYNSGVPTDLSSLSPVHWWRMGDNDDRTGTTITDQGSGGSNLTLTNGPTFSTDVPGGGGASFSNSHAVSFDGTDDYISVGSVGDTYYDLGTNDFSFSFWLKFNSLPAAYIGVFGMSRSSTGYNVYLKSNGTLAFYNAPSLYQNLSSALSTGQWYHIAFVRNSGSLTVYVDGTAGTPASVGSLNFDSGSSVSIGDDVNASFPPIDGLIDEFALWKNHALTTSDISNLRGGASSGTLGEPVDISSIGTDNSGNSGPDNWWRMGDNDGATGTTITDQGSGGKDGTLTNGPTFSTDVPS
jgi:hypothetical protein